MIYNIVQDGLEVIEEDGIGGTFKDKSETPVRVDTTAGCDVSSRHSGICKEESYRDELGFSQRAEWKHINLHKTYHAEKHNAKSRVDADK